MDRDVIRNLNRRRVLQLLVGGSLATGGLGGIAGSAVAAEGEKLGEIRFPATGSNGVSTTFTGEHLIVADGFTTNELDVYEPVQDGDATSVSTKVLSEQISGITWDYTRGKLWATEGNDGVFYLIDIGDPTRSGEAPTVEQRFTLPGNLRGWPADGLTYDGGEDAIWWTYDDSGEVYKLDTDGTVLDSIVPAINDAGEEFEYISGVAVGASRNDRPTLYLGDNATEGGGDVNAVVRVYADTGENIQTFTDVQFRVEDITCDPVTYSPSEALIIKDAFDNKATAFEVEAGTCPVATDPDPAQLQDAIDEFESGFQTLVAGEFRGQGRHHAALYDQYGEEYASELVDFWGYRAGEVPADQLGESARELGDASLEMAREEVGFEYDESDARLLYEFFDEMFAAMADADSLEDRKEIGEQYYLGTYPGQETALTFDDDKTLAEGLNEDWDLRTTVYDELRDGGELTQDQIQRAATGLAEKAGRLRRRGEAIVESKENAALELPNQYQGTHKEIQARRIGDEVGDSAGTQAIGTTILLATAAAGLVSYAGGYLTTKCSTTRAAAEAKGAEFDLVDVPYKPRDNALTSAFQTGLTLGQLVQATGDAAGANAAEQSAGEAAVVGSFLTGTFLAGAKTAAVDLGVTGGKTFVQSRFAQRAEGEIVTLDLPDIEDSTRLDPLSSFLESLPFIGDWFDDGGPTNGEATGTIEIQNTGDVGFTPAFELEYRLRNSRGKFGSAFTAEVEGPREFLSPGETATYDVTYQVPTDEGVLAGELAATLGLVPAEPPTPGDFLPGVCELDYQPTTDRAVDTFRVSESVRVDTPAAGSVSAGNREQTTFVPDAGTQQATLDLNFEGYVSDLHLFDEAGNHVGWDYENGTVENEIPGAAYSGRDTGGSNSEWITFPTEDQNYTVEVRSPSLAGNVAAAGYAGSDTSSAAVGATNATTSEFRVDSVEVPELPPKLSTTPSVLSARASPDDEAVTPRLVVSEANGDQPAEGVTLSVTDLTGNGGRISASNVSFSRNGFDVADSVPVDVSVSLPSDVEVGQYTGEITLESGNAESLVVEFTLRIGEVDEGPPALPGQDNPPQDLDGDGRYEDVNGDGQFTIADVQVFFQHRDSAAVQNNPEAFNFDGEEPADVSIRDVQALFGLFQERD